MTAVVNLAQRRQLDELNRNALAAYLEGALKPRAERCGKCAFRPGSPERCMGMGWVNAAESWADGSTIFLCHEGIPGHQQQVEGETLHVCAGFHEMQGRPVWEWARLAHADDREPDPKFITEKTA